MRNAFAFMSTSKNINLARIHAYLKKHECLNRILKSNEKLKHHVTLFMQACIERSRDDVGGKHNVCGMT